MPLLDGLVERVHHEHLLQASIEDAYLHLPGAASANSPGFVDVAIAFVDLESFTHLTETEGDQAAMDILARFDPMVRTLALEHDGKLVKQIGDGLMLAFRCPAQTITFALALHQAVRIDPSFPAVRIGAHAGPAIYRVRTMV